MAEDRSTSDDAARPGVAWTAAGLAFGVARWTFTRVLGVALAAVDLTALVREHLDIDAVAQDLDVDAVVERVDTAAIANRLLDEIDLPEIVRESSDALASEAVSGVRTRAIRADNVVTRVVGRVLHRQAEPPPGSIPNQVAHYRPAGVVSRLLGAILDTGAAAALTFLLYFCVAGLRFMIWPSSFRGLLFAAMGPTRHSLQDRLLRSTVVYDWHHDGGARAAATAPD